MRAVTLSPPSPLLPTKKRLVRKYPSTPEVLVVSPSHSISSCYLTPRAASVQPTASILDTPYALDGIKCRDTVDASTSPSSSSSYPALTNDYQLHGVSLSTKAPMSCPRPPAATVQRISRAEMFLSLHKQIKTRSPTPAKSRSDISYLLS
ncbi:Aste57867_10214 [Aphanomyces stellatus]|uniref:Aste57867_10214 protein n=1 Tax=Aphanomyces stellatus TaxID=120398 RepID=A0A485KPS7_9STRA|nr:hypothetical protein As57867_010175 [Aphanomyces stellatus]VFT87090.1 Aste57867_10214 [Aphanomyces stellatus]